MTEIFYKATGKDNKSLMIVGKDAVQYIVNEWVGASPRAAALGCHLLVFDSFAGVSALGRDLVAWRCEIDGVIKDKPQGRIVFPYYEQASYIDFNGKKNPAGWPPYTVMAKKVKILKKIDMKIIKMDIFNNLDFVGTIDISYIMAMIAEKYHASLCANKRYYYLGFHDDDAKFDKFMLEYGETIEDTKADRGVKNETYMRA